MSTRRDTRPGRDVARWMPRHRSGLTGEYLVSESAIAEAERLLPTYRGVDGDHEGLVFLCGRELGDGTTLLTTAIAPQCEHVAGRVMAPRYAVGEVARAARDRALAVLAQVHTHPAGWTEHSAGDDHMVLMPFDGMLSIVVAHYGRYGMRPLDAQGVHQYRDGAWHLAREDAIRDAITILPAGIDLR